MFHHQVDLAESAVEVPRDQVKTVRQQVVESDLFGLLP
jgi:hypothetical protein